MTLEELEAIRITEPSGAVFREVKSEWDRMAKPLDGMGIFEELTARIGAILEKPEFDLKKKAVVVMCADNGIVEEGVSQSGQEVTLLVSSAMGKELSSVGKMAKSIGADVIPVDIGINCKKRIDGVLDRKIAHGTKNFLREPAMTKEETLAAIQTGMDLVYACRQKGYRLIATGEMGIGNTTTAGAVAAALLGCGAENVTGRGAGLSDAGLVRKKRVISEAIEKYRLKKEEPFDILKTVGGLDIAGMVGLFIGAAVYHIPVVMDGMISAAAALTALRIKPGIRDYLIPSHKSREPAVEPIMEELRLRPVIDASMALGEGTGAVMMFALLDMAMSLYHGMTTFSEMGVGQYRRF